ncbi:MAG: primosomal protein N' [Sinobacterium sp.]|nr:primosomal protein N' [Sinobacterium sp.]
MFDDAPLYLLEVCVPVPLRKNYSYLHNGTVEVGSRVSVKFSGRMVIAIVLSCKSVTQDELPSYKLSSVIQVLDDRPTFSDDLLTLLRWGSDYYQHPLGEVFQTALPVGLRQAETLQDLSSKFTQKEYRLSGSFDKASIKSSAHAQLALVSAIEKQTPFLHEYIKALGLKSASLRALLKKGTIEESVFEPSIEAVSISDDKPELNDEQAVVLSGFKALHDKFSAILLEGVTGSGKTEVYLRCIEEVLKADKQVLVLVPEIGLTPQTIGRFMQRFKCPIAVLHSGLGDSERLQAYLQARSGIARIIIGTRSAIFTPMLNPGLIVLDEEHDLSYKQHDGFRYHARDLAIIRAKQLNIPVLMGTATPSFESLNNAIQGRYQHFELTQRAANAQPPTMRLVDVRGQALTEGLSPQVQSQIATCIEREEQVLLFINRRGFAHSLICHDCGWQSECHACSAKMTVHLKANHLRCHHCQATQLIPSNCTACSGERLVYQGVGTQRLESYLQEQYPSTPVFRIDRDSTKTKAAFEKALDEIHTAKGALLIGTQMLAKGHHLPNVTLVVVLDADSSLGSTDYRAHERLGQLITQVSGRAGREEKPGLALIQTHYSDHPILQTLLYDGYGAMAREELAERELLQLPPYTFQALLRLEDKSETVASQTLERIRSFCESKQLPVFVVGPFPAPLQRRAGYFRYQLLLQSSQRGQLSGSLKYLLSVIGEFTASNQRFSIDVDPQDMA